MTVGIRFDRGMHPDDLFRDAQDPLTVQELATIWRVSRPTVSQLIESGELEAFRIGRNWRVRRASAIAYMQRSATASPDDGAAHETD